MTAVGITASAEVVVGKRTNRIKRTRRIDTTESSPQRGLIRYKQDPEKGRGLAQVKICVSMPVQVLAELDALAERASMSRSHLIRQAVAYFGAYLDGPSDHHRTVNEQIDTQTVTREVRALRAEVARLADRLEGL